MQIPDQLLRGYIEIYKKYKGLAVKDSLYFMPEGFRSPENVQTLFACENNMTVLDLLYRFQNYSQHINEFYDVTDSCPDASQWRLYVQTRGRHALNAPRILKVFNKNFRVLDIPSYILSENSCLVLSMLPEHTTSRAYYPGT